MEDAALLARLLSQVQRKDDIPMAMSVFDDLRRPRGRRAMSLSREVGQIFCGRKADIGLDLKKILQSSTAIFEELWNFDVVPQIEEGLKQLKDRIGGS